MNAPAPQLWFSKVTDTRIQQFHQACRDIFCREFILDKPDAPRFKYAEGSGEYNYPDMPQILENLGKLSMGCATAQKNTLYTYIQGTDFTKKTLLNSIYFMCGFYFNLSLSKDSRNNNREFINQSAFLVHCLIAYNKALNEWGDQMFPVEESYGLPKSLLLTGSQKALEVLKDFYVEESKPVEQTDFDQPQSQPSIEAALSDALSDKPISSQYNTQPSLQEQSVDVEKQKARQRTCSKLVGLFDKLSKISVVEHNDLDKMSKLDRMLHSFEVITGQKFDKLSFLQKLESICKDAAILLKYENNIGFRRLANDIIIEDCKSIASAMQNVQVDINEMEVFHILLDGFLDGLFKCDKDHYTVGKNNIDIDELRIGCLSAKKSIMYLCLLHNDSTLLSKYNEQVKNLLEYMKIDSSFFDRYNNQVEAKQAKEALAQPQENQNEQKDEEG